MAAKELKKATENLACSVCYQVFRNPKYLPCHHSFCEECLERLLKESKITCPECRGEATVPVRGVKGLPNNFLINRLVDELILKRKVDGEEEVRCDKCEEDDAVVSYCPDCGDFMCHICNESHKRDKRSRDHKIVPLAELKSNKDALQVKPKILLCKEHDYELKHYCETCEQLVCLYCTMKEHSDHSHDTVKNMADKHRKELKESTAPVDNMIRGLTQAHDSIDKVKKNIQQRGDEVDKEIDKYYNEIVQKLMNQKKQIKEQLHNTLSQKQKALEMQLEEIELTQGEVISMKELKIAVEKSSDQEALSAKKLIITRMNRLSEQYSNLNIQPVETPAMQFIKAKQGLPQFSQLKFDVAINSNAPVLTQSFSQHSLPPANSIWATHGHSYKYTTGQTQKSKLPRARAQLTETLPAKATYDLSQMPTTSVGEVQKCKKCREFFANEEYGALCSACFKKFTIEEATQKSLQHQSRSRPLSYSSSHIQQCKAHGCSRDAAGNCQGYCALCFDKAYTVKVPPAL